MAKIKYVLKHCHIDKPTTEYGDMAKRILEVQKSDFYVTLNKLIDLNYTFQYRNDKFYKQIVVFTQGNLEYTEVWNLLNLCEVKK